MALWAWSTMGDTRGSTEAGIGTALSWMRRRWKPFVSNHDWLMAPGPSIRPLCDIPSGCCFFTGPWTVTRSSLCMLCRIAAFCWLLQPVLLLVLFLRSRSPVVGVLGLCWMWHAVPFARQQRPVGILRLCWFLWGSFDCFCCPHTSVHRPSTTCLSAPPPPPESDGPDKPPPPGNTAPARKVLSGWGSSRHCHTKWKKYSRSPGEPDFSTGGGKGVSSGFCLVYP